MAKDFVTVVSGLPRSGTSLMMQMLHAGGMPVLTDGLRTADENNQRGYFEFDPVKRLRSDRSWLPQARGHAVKIIHLLLRDLLLDGSLQYRIVFMRRPLDEVLASQRVMLQRDGKAGADPAVLKRAFESQLAQLDAWLSAQAGITVLPVQHPQLMREPLAVADALSDFLGLALDKAAMVGVVDPNLHRQRGA
jgi:hypothetical protein